MKLKKIGMIAVSAVLVFGMTACGREKGQPQEELKQQQQEQSMETQIQEESRKIYENEEEIFEEFPKLKEVREYLFENYPALSRKAQETIEAEEYKKPINFGYSIGEGDPSRLRVDLNFNESATKKEMVEAIQYVSKEIDSLFLEGTDIEFYILAKVRYFGDKYMENYWKERGAIKLEYKKGEDTKYKWQEKIEPNYWGTLYIDEVKPDEVVAYFEEEKPQEETPAPAVEEKTSGITIDEIIGIMEASQEYDEINMKEFSREKEETTGHVISKGGNEEGSYTFEITANGEEQSISGIYKVKRLAEMSDEDFKTECMKYLKRSAFSQYASAEGLATYRYVNEAVKYVIGSNGLEKEFIIQNTRFEIISEEEGNCIAMYVTNYVE